MAPTIALICQGVPVLEEYMATSQQNVVTCRSIAARRMSLLRAHLSASPARAKTWGPARTARRLPRKAVAGQ